MFATVPMWVPVLLGVAFFAILIALVWRMRSIREAARAAAAAERETMADRLSLIEDVPPAPTPRSMYTRPEERWTRHPLPKQKRLDQD